jgi:hypothetical protein
MKDTFARDICVLPIKTFEEESNPVPIILIKEFDGVINSKQNGGLNGIKKSR